MSLGLNGETLPPGFQSRLGALSRRLEAEGLPAIVLASGTRAKSLQEQIFRDRYIPVADAGGRNPFNDKRWWLGMWWVRVKAGGTVLPPGQSTHEDPPGTGADLAWPYNNRYTAAHARLLQLCEECGIRWTGRNFGEDWHFDDIWNPYATFASGGSNAFEEDDMNSEQDRTLKEAASNIGIVKQLLSETVQWKGIGQLVSETYLMVGIIKQVLVETESWTGIDTRVSQVLAGVTQLHVDTAFAASRDAARDAALEAAVRSLATGTGIDPTKLGEIVSAAAREGAAAAISAADLPTEASMAAAVNHAAAETRLAALKAEVTRLQDELAVAQSLVTPADGS